MELEIWREVEGYEGLYQVSDLGRVKSLPRLVRNRYGLILTNEIIKKHHVANDGYCQVNLVKDKKVKMFRVHQLVAVAFLSHKIDRHKMTVNHVNHNRSDNKVDNLEIVTQRENNSKKSVIGTSKYTGVSWSKYRNKWVSQISINGKCKFLGHYENEIDGANAYKKALKDIS